MTQQEIELQFPDAEIVRGIGVVVIRQGDTQLSVSFDRTVDGAVADAFATLSSRWAAISAAV